MPIREAKEFVTLTWAGDHTSPQRVEVLNAYRAALVERMRQDVEHLEVLNRKIDFYSGVIEMRDATPEDVTGVRAVAS
jgi:hypothetical protein